MSDFQIGDIVIPQGTTQLRSGCGYYTCAVVVLAKPLILVSPAGDMKWSETTKDMALTKIATATKAKVKILQKRLYDDFPKGTTYKDVLATIKSLYCAKQPANRLIGDYIISVLYRWVVGPNSGFPYHPGYMNGIREHEISAPFEHEWARRQHYINAVLRRLRLPPIQVKIPKSYLNKWGDIVKIENNRVVRTGKTSFASPFAKYWAAKGVEISK